jgi:transcriptional regulator with GAF, ATPase, and Fis domain
MMIVAWLKNLPDLDTPAGQLVRDALRTELRESDDAPFGIVVLQAVRQETEQQLRKLARGTKVIVLLAPGVRLGSQEKWSLLGTCVADVLEWPSADRIADVILPRLARWREIEGLIAGDRAMQSVAGDSQPWRRILREAAEIAAFSGAGLLLTGETGTGKEQIARLVHQLDRRPRKADLVTVDCTTLSRELIGSELFGHERGAFTGAVARHDGALGLAHQGTLFLDEIGELELPLQAQLLRVIQERSYKRIGSNFWQQADFRLICATNRDLEHEVRQGRFRADLYYRIADRTLHLPPLRERREDILPLAAHFWRLATGSAKAPAFDPALSEHLTTRDYPGNVRDLRRIVMALHSRHAGGSTVSIGALPEFERPTCQVSSPDDAESAALSSFANPWEDPHFTGVIESALARGMGLREIGRAATSAAIRLVLSREDGNLQRAARSLGVTDRALQMRRAAAE